jgi:hypothetical protein
MINYRILQTVASGIFILVGEFYGPLNYVCYKEMVNGALFVCASRTGIDPLWGSPGAMEISTKRFLTFVFFFRSVRNSFLEAAETIPYFL